MNDYIKRGEDYIKNLSAEFKVCMCCTFIIGLIAHMFVYTNPMFIWDDSAVYSESFTLADEAASSRWLGYFFHLVMGLVKMTWLYGVLNFIIYGFSAYAIVKIFHIERKLSVALISGIMVTCPTFTSGNLFIGSSVQYACGLLSACLAVYVFYYFKHKYLWCGFFLLICEGCYAAYIDTAMALFLFKSLIDLCKEKNENFKENFLEQLKFAVLCIFTMLLTYIIMKVITILSTSGLQRRVEIVEGRSLLGWLVQVFETYARAVFVYLPLGKCYFWGNKVLFFLFWITVLYTVFLYIKALKENKSIGKNTILILLDILILPLAINAIGMLFIAHDLMRWAFITPWIFIIAFHEKVVTTAFDSKYASRSSVLVLALSMITIVNGIYIANMAYMKEYVVYESAMQLTTRVSDRIESADGYIVGETPVYLVGKPKQYEINRKQFDFVWQLTGSVQFSFSSIYLKQQAGLPINIIGVYSQGQTNSPVEQLRGMGYDVDVEKFEQLLSETEEFPSKYCTFWYDNILVVKLSDLSEDEEEVTIMDLPHRIMEFFKGLMEKTEIY